MNKLSFGIALLIAQFGWSQDVRTVGDFNSIKVFDKINVELIPSSTNKVELIGENVQDVELVNKNGELKIRQKLEKMFDGEEITAKVYFKNLQFIDANEGSSISCDAVIKQTALDISAKEGAGVELKLDVQKAKVRAVTEGVVTLSGKSYNQEINIGTGGIVNGKNFKTTQSTVNITTGGEAGVFATELVDAQVKMGGTVTIYGKPKQINQKTVLGGKIIEAQSEN